jgi:hypothetical protein
MNYNSAGGDDEKSMCDKILEMSGIACLYFGAVLVLLLLIIMQLWKVGYYSSEHNQGHVGISPGDAASWARSGNFKDNNVAKYMGQFSQSGQAESSGIAANASEHFSSNLPAEYLVNNRGEPDFWTITSDLDAYKTSQVKGMAKGAAANAAKAAAQAGAAPAASAAAGNAAGGAAAAGAAPAEVAAATAGAAAAAGAAPAAAAAAGNAAVEAMLDFGGMADGLKQFGSALTGFGGSEYAVGTPGDKTLNMFHAGSSGAEHFGGFEHNLENALIGR